MPGKPEPGAGDVPIMLTGDRLVLVPSMQACRDISKLAGESLRMAEQRVFRLDFEFMVDVVALGLGETAPKIKQQIAERVWKTGLLSIMADLILYLRTIMNGGIRPPEAEGEVAAELVISLENSLPQELSEHLPALEKIREAIIAHYAEDEEDESEDPLAGNPSPSENFIDA